MLTSPDAETDPFRTLGPQEVLREIAAAAHEVPIAEFEGRPAAELCSDLVPRVLDLSRRSLRVLDSLVESEYEERSDDDWLRGETGRAFLRRVDRLMREVDSADHVGGLAFMARGELREKIRRLESFGADFDSWEIIDGAGSALREIVKTATGLDQLIGQSTGEIFLDFETELDSSREVRRIYGKLRRDLGRSIEAPGGAARGGDLLRSQIRNASTAIARLIGRDAYPKLRIGDRVEIRSLQKRLLDWMSGPCDAASGRRLLEDLNGFVGLLAQISHRQELVEHDRTTISEALTVLGLPSDGLPAELRTMLEESLDALYGLDEELDAWIVAPESDLEALEPILERLASSARSGGQSSGRPQW